MIFNKGVKAIHCQNNWTLMRKEEESKFAEMKKKHENHPKVNHPVRTVNLPMADSC